MTTLKHRIGKRVLPLLPFNRRTFDILRYENHALWLNAYNRISPRTRKVVKELQERQDISLNLGSGGRGLPDWVNIEFTRMKDTTLVWDIRRSLPLRSGSASRVLAEHVMEHLDFRSDALALAKEVHRVLRPGGVFRVVVPDCRRYVEAYCKGDAEIWAGLGWSLDRLPHDIYTPMHILNHQFHQGGEHLFGYDFVTMKHLLTQAGFSDTRQMSFRKSIDPKLEIDQENHQLYSLYVDAIR